MTITKFPSITFEYSIVLILSTFMTMEKIAILRIPRGVRVISELKEEHNSAAPV